MLLPKRVKHRKQFRGSMAGKATRGNKIDRSGQRTHAAIRYDMLHIVTHQGCTEGSRFLLTEPTLFQQLITGC